MKFSQLLKSKIHHARVTYANPDYVGSIEVGGDLMDAVGLMDGEFVHVWAVDHTSRLETYVFRGPNGVIGLNGGAAHFFKEGDRVIIAAFCMTDEPVIPQMVLVNESNEIVRDMTPFTVHG
ncbi:MAG: aspartate 1-decarboxylase [Fimbriimonadaceae bacterium]|nr:aspartate 1-decarboxylase [Fimbriimonadaceae bacterium]MBX3334580.1 aspartate 1-decarboxylase [Nitrospira sp.]